LSESVDHLFFGCPIIRDFWFKVLTYHNNQISLNTTTILDFWTASLLLPKFQFWGTLLAACLWVIWLERNKRIFSSSNSSVANIHFHILHLYKTWTGSSSNLEHILIVDVAPVTTSGAVNSISDPIQTRVSPTSGGISDEDVDLLD
jgi:hypothetical protein